MTFILGILSAIVGTAFMTLSSETEMIVSGRSASDAPGQAASRILSLLGARPLRGKALKVASTWMHWLYGAAWGVVFWLLRDSDLGDLPWLVAAVLFWLIVWGAAQVVQPLLGVAKPTWTYGAKATMTDGFHHLVYAAGTTLAAWLMTAGAEGGSLGVSL